MSDPRQSAVLFIECQRGVDRRPLRPPGPRRGGPAGARRPWDAWPPAPVAAGARVAHLTYLPLAGGRSAPAGSTPLMRGPRSNAEWNESHPALEVIPEIGVGPDDLVLPRHQGISPVYRTEVLSILRNLGVEEVVVAGVSTNLAIPLTVVGAADEDFAVTVATDASVGTPAVAPRVDAQAQPRVRGSPRHGRRAARRVAA